MKSLRPDVFLVGVLFIVVGVQAQHAPDFKIECGRVATTSVFKSDTVSVWGLRLSKNDINVENP